MGTCASSTGVVSLQPRNLQVNSDDRADTHNDGVRQDKTRLNRPAHSSQISPDLALHNEGNMLPGTADDTDIGSRMAQVPSTARPENILVEPQEDLFPEFEGAEKEIRLVLFGQAGSGKSALGNMIIGSEVFSRRQTNVLSESYTKQVTKKDTKIYNRRVVVVDTPGIKTSIEFRKHMDEAFHLVQPGPHIFLLVISLDRQFYLQTIRLFEEIMLKYVVIVFTMQSNIDITLEDILNDIQGLRVYFDEFQLRHIIVKSWYRDLNDLNNSRNLEVKRLLQICERHARPEIFFKPATLNS